MLHLKWPESDFLHAKLKYVQFIECLRASVLQIL
jgi:hypothetical protein